MLFTKFIACILVATLGYAKAASSPNQTESLHKSCSSNNSANLTGSLAKTPKSGRQPLAILIEYPLGEKSTCLGQEKRQIGIRNLKALEREWTKSVPFRDGASLNAMSENIFWARIGVIMLSLSITNMYSGITFSVSNPKLSDLFRPIVETAPNRTIGLLEIFISTLSFFSPVFFISRYDTEASLQIKYYTVLYGVRFMIGYFNTAIW